MFQELNELRQSELIDGWIVKKIELKQFQFRQETFFLGVLAWLKLVDKREILFFISTAGRCNIIY